MEKFEGHYCYSEIGECLTNKFGGFEFVPKVEEDCDWIPKRYPVNFCPMCGCRGSGCRIPSYTISKVAQ